MTVQNEGLICHVNVRGRDITAGRKKNLFCLFNNENISVFLHFRIMSHNLKLYIYMHVYIKRTEKENSF